MTDNQAIEYDLNSSPSFRLNELLDQKGYPSLKEGRAKALVEKTKTPASTVTKWLKLNALPRTIEERIKVCNLIGISLIYWEYGIVIVSDEQSNPNLIDEDDPDLMMSIALKVVEAAQKIGIDINDKNSISRSTVYKINKITNYFAKKTGLKKPDTEFINMLLELVKNKERKE